MQQDLGDNRRWLAAGIEGGELKVSLDKTYTSLTKNWTAALSRFGLEASEFMELYEPDGKEWLTPYLAKDGDGTVQYMTKWRQTRRAILIKRRAATIAKAAAAQTAVGEKGKQQTQVTEIQHDPTSADARDVESDSSSCVSEDGESDSSSCVSEGVESDSSSCVSEDGESDSSSCVSEDTVEENQQVVDGEEWVTVLNVATEAVDIQPATRLLSQHDIAVVQRKVREQ